MTNTQNIALSFIKAAIITVIVVGAIASLSSCERVAQERYSNKWRAVAIKTGRHITVVNTDSMAVMPGDTVTVFFFEGDGLQPSYYYIANIPDIACDTISTEMYIDGKDTIYEKFEAWNCVLDRRVTK